MPGFDLMLGEELAIVVVTTVEDQRVGIPMAVPALFELHTLLGEPPGALHCHSDGTAEGDPRPLRSGLNAGPVGGGPAGLALAVGR
jgi:hypothetical protein